MVQYFYFGSSEYIANVLLETSGDGVLLKATDNELEIAEKIKEAEVKVKKVKEMFGGLRISFYICTRNSFIRA